MSDLGAVAAERAEVSPPFGRHAARLGEKLLVEPFDVGRIGSLQWRRIVLILEYGAHERRPGREWPKGKAQPKAEGGLV